MDLKEFIKYTISQISDAIVELNDGQQHMPLVVNPPEAKGQDNVISVLYKSWNRIVSPVSFHVAIKEVKDNSKGIGLSLKVVSGENKNGHAAENCTTIDFPIYVVFPSVKIDKIQ